MMLKYIRILVIIMALFFEINVVNANIICNDGTTSATCTTCSKGCCSRHGGCTVGGPTTSSSSSGVSSSKSSSSPSKSSNSTRSKSSSGKSSFVNSIPTIVVKKDSNNKLKKLTIDGENITIKDSMEYQTVKEEVVLRVETDSSKATANYNKQLKLNHGDNEEKITVKAEDGSTKIYSLKVKKVNDNTNIKKILINDEEISLNTMSYKTTTKDVTINIVLEDEYAVAIYPIEKELSVGKNEIIINVTAESGDKKEYNLTIEYDDTMDKVAAAIVTTTAIGGSGAGVYYGIRQQKKKKANSIICLNCNKRNATDDTFCIYCGKKL